VFLTYIIAIITTAAGGSIFTAGDFSFSGPYRLYDRGDGSVNASDVTAVYNIILGN